MIKIFSQQNYKQIQLHSREPMPQNTKSDGKTYNPEFLNSLLKSAQTEESDTDWAYLWSHQTEMTASATSIEKYVLLLKSTTTAQNGDTVKHQNDSNSWLVFS